MQDHKNDKRYIKCLDEIDKIKDLRVVIPLNFNKRDYYSYSPEWDTSSFMNDHRVMDAAKCMIANNIIQGGIQMNTGTPISQENLLGLFGLTSDLDFEELLSHGRFEYVSEEISKKSDKESKIVLSPECLIDILRDCSNDIYSLRVFTFLKKNYILFGPRTIIENNEITQGINNMQLTDEKKKILLGFFGLFGLDT